MPTVIEELKPVVLVKYGFEYRENLKVKCFLWKFRTIRIQVQEKKTMVLHLETSL